MATLTKHNRVISINIGSESPYAHMELTPETDLWSSLIEVRNLCQNTTRSDSAYFKTVAIAQAKRIHKLHPKFTRFIVLRNMYESFCLVYDPTHGWLHIHAAALIARVQVTNFKKGIINGIEAVVGINLEHQRRLPYYFTSHTLLGGDETESLPTEDFTVLSNTTRLTFPLTQDDRKNEHWIDLMDKYTLLDREACKRDISKLLSIRQQTYPDRTDPVLLGFGKDNAYLFQHDGDFLWQHTIQIKGGDITVYEGNQADSTITDIDALVVIYEPRLWFEQNPPARLATIEEIVADLDLFNQCQSMRVDPDSAMPTVPNMFNATVPATQQEANWFDESVKSLAESCSNMKEEVAHWTPIVGMFVIAEGYEGVFVIDDYLGQTETFILRSTNSGYARVPVHASKVSPYQLYAKRPLR